MTADAKVGLLLGLVFIVIIAFLVNGLPNFLKTAEAQDVVINTITPPAGPELVIDDQVINTARQLEPQIALRQTEPPQGVILLNPASANQTSQAVEPVQPVSQVQPVAQVQPVEPVQPAAETKPIEPVKPVFGNPAAASDAYASVQQKPAANSRVHVIQSGESLTTVAQKYYGKENGKKYSVIQKLYEANKDVLESPNKVQVGDKLSVPPINDLTGQQTVVAKPDASKTLLNKFSSMLTRTGGEEKKEAAATTYTVKKGDNLWDIAEHTLGSGSRYKDIVKANQDKIKSEKDVKIGMQLKIPK